ncbi:hypothetical protein QJQ45_012269 [Haematococcus lacustris]|nr:hypothetical protein QJQ45_012269 [Haematococcus lacustris]
MELLGTCYVPAKNVLGFATDDPRFAVVALITECNSKGGATVVGSLDGASFRKLFKLDYEPSGFTVDSGGCFWLTQKNIVKRYTAKGEIIRGEGFRIPQADTVSAVVTALHCLGDKLYILRKSGSRQTTDGQTREQSVLMEYDMVDGSLSVVAEHLAADCRIAVFPCGRVFFISTSRSLCQLNLGSKEVKVLDSSFPHPSARLFPGESGGALLVPGWWGRSQVHSCTSKGKLAPRTSWFGGLPVNDGMLAVNSSGDILFWVKDKKNPQLLELMRLPASSVYKKGTITSFDEVIWLGAAPMSELRLAFSRKYNHSTARQARSASLLLVQAVLEGHRGASNDSTLQRGQYLDDLPHGHGVYSFAAGQRYEGQWHAGRKPAGQCSEWVALWSASKPQWVQPLAAARQAAAEAAATDPAAPTSPNLTAAATSAAGGEAGQGGEGEVASSTQATPDALRVEGGGAGQAGLGGLEQQAAAGEALGGPAGAFRAALEAQQEAAKASEVAGQRAREHWDAVGPVQPALRSAVAAAERAAAAAQAARTRARELALRLDLAVALMREGQLNIKQQQQQQQQQGREAVAGTGTKAAPQHPTA